MNDTQVGHSNEGSKVVQSTWNEGQVAQQSTFQRLELFWEQNQLSPDAYTMLEGIFKDYVVTLAIGLATRVPTLPGTRTTSHINKRGEICKGVKRNKQPCSHMVYKHSFGGYCGMHQKQRPETSSMSGSSSGRSTPPSIADVDVPPTHYCHFIDRSVMPEKECNSAGVHETGSGYWYCDEHSEVAETYEKECPSISTDTDDEED